MQREIERLEEERIQLKTENRKLARQIGGKVSEHSLRNLTNDLVLNLWNNYRTDCIPKYCLISILGCKSWIGCR